MAKPMKRPIVRDPANKQFSELPDGQFVDVAALPLGGADSSGAPNLLKSDSEGLTVRAGDFVSPEAGNALRVRGGMLYVPDMSATAEGLVSRDSGNELQVGSDGGLFVDQTVVSADTDNLVTVGSDGGAKLTPNDMLSNGHTNLLTIDPIDRKIILTKENIQGNLPVISQDEGNLVHPGSDKGVYLSMDDILNRNDTILYEDKDGHISSGISLAYSPDTGKLDILGHDGQTVISTVRVPGASSSLKGVYLVDGMPSESGEDIEGDYHFSLMFAQADGVWGDPVPATVRTHKSAAVSTSIESVAGMGAVRVRGVFNGQTEEQFFVGGTAALQFADGTRIIVTPEATRLEVIFEPGVGLIPGTYLVFVYALAVGTVQDVYVDVSALVDIYRAGCGIDISSSREVSVKLHPEGAIKCDPASGLGVSPGAGLTLKDNDLVLNLGTGGDNPIKVSPDGSIGIDFTKLLSTDSDNVLRLGSDGKLKVVVVSADKGNLLVLGSDKGAYTPMNRGDMPATT